MISEDIAESSVPKIISTALSIITVLFPTWRFYIRVRRYRHRVPNVGLAGCLSCLLLGILFFVPWAMSGAEDDASRTCVNVAIIYVIRAAFVICQILLYTHFILKAQLLNRDGKFFTKLQIISILLVLPVPVIGFFVVFTVEAVSLPTGGCGVRTNHTWIIIQGIFHVINSVVPAFSFIEQTCDLLTLLPSSTTRKSRKISNPISVRARLIYTILRDPAALRPVKSRKNKGLTSNVTDDRQAMSDSTDLEGKGKIIRLMRRVLLATFYSVLTTMIIYAITLSGVLTFDTPELYNLDISISWVWAIYASPLPQEEGKRSGFSSKTSSTQVRDTEEPSPISRHLSCDLASLENHTSQDELSDPGEKWEP